MTFGDDKTLLLQSIRDAFRRIVVHDGFWRNEAMRQFGLETGLALEVEVSLPDNMKNLPLVDGGKVIAAMSDADSQAITVEAPGDPKKIKEFYKTALPKAGWKVEMEMEQNDMAILTLGKDEWKVMISASKTGEGTVTYSMASAV